MLCRFVAVDDIAEVAATALTTQQYDNKIVTVQGPTAISKRQQVRIISQLLGKPIEVAAVSEEEYKKLTPVPPPVVDSVHISERFRRETGADFQAQTDALVTGKLTFEEFITRHKSELAE